MFFKKFLTFVFVIHTSDLVLHSKAENTLRYVAQNEYVTFVEESGKPNYNTPHWSAIFDEQHLNMTMTQKRIMKLTIAFIDPEWGQAYEFHILPQDKNLLNLSNNIITAKDVAENQISWSGNFTVDALFLGRSKIYVELRRPYKDAEISAETSEIIVLRNISKIDLIFNVCVGIFVVLLNINFGTVLDLNALKAIVKRPIGPAIGFIGQFLVMPVLAFLIGFLMFRDMIELRLGLFITGCTPGGGSSNIFAIILGGNLNLSIAMTAISNLAAFGMMPLWIFTLGALIFNDGNLSVPYGTIALMSCSLMAPLCIGIALKKCFPTVTKKIAIFLKPLSLCFIIFITVFAFTVNSYIFKLFSWQIIFATSALPWIGYILSYILALMCRCSQSDALTIAIETGIQNTGIAIFMLNFTLPQPQADMTSAIPVANSMMTPLPLLLIYVLKKVISRINIEKIEQPRLRESKSTEPKTIVEKSREMGENKDINKT